MSAGVIKCSPLTIILLFGVIASLVAKVAELQSGYVHSSITYCVRHDLITDPALECFCVELKLPFTAPVLILNAYRSPSSNAQTDTSLATCIENVVAQNKECFILGDYNINTLCARSCSNRLLKSIHSLGLSQMVDKPTRVDLTAQQDLLRLPHLSTTSTFPMFTILLKSMFPMSPSVTIILYSLSDDEMPVFVRERMLILPSIIDRSRTLTKRSLKKI